MERRPDIHDYNRQFQSVIRRLNKENILSENKKTIAEFDKVCALEGLSAARRCRIIGCLIMTSKLLDMDFREASKEDLKNTVLKIDSNEKWSVATKHTYKAIIKKFYKWLALGDEYKWSQGYPETVSWMRCSIKSKDQPRVQASDILSEREVEKMLEAAEHPRDKAFISMLYELGARIGEVGSLRIRDISRDKYSFIVYLSGKSGHLSLIHI